jgi:hypothetical protein
MTVGVVEKVSRWEFFEVPEESGGLGLAGTTIPSSFWFIF